MEDLLVGLAPLLQLEPSVLKEKSESEEGITEIINHVKSLKIMKSEAFAELNDNIRKDYKDSMYKEVKGAALEMFEKDLKRDTGYEFKSGEDYNSALELVKLIRTKELEKLKPEVVTDDARVLELTKDIEALTEKIKTNSETFNTEKEGLTSSHEKAITDMVLASEFLPYKNQLDVEETLVDGKLEMLELIFRQKHTIVRKEGEFVVLDSEGEVIKDENVKAKTPAQVIGEFVPKYEKLKEFVPKSGRGTEEPGETTGSNGQINWSKFDSWEDFLKSDNGKGLVAGQFENDRLYKEFKEAKAAV